MVGIIYPGAPLCVVTQVNDVGEGRGEISDLASEGDVHSAIARSFLFGFKSLQFRACDS